MVTADQVREAAIKAKLTYVPHHECGLCGEWVAHEINLATGELFFSPACGCSFRPSEPRTWQSVADEINMQNEEWRVKLMQRWGMGSNIEFSERAKN